ncbi:hypothetical protein C922_04905 [Plasmodium inui San Antonio 1]|uniref:Uncharacterized protein n=1 Tax=Plasmodium inui San Antonio 1 TaxID=1237626 RepID=W7AHL6_9APIC|nr:hypothetical protein C922_04905 [Plasmodium inui San Antonio 1]EUD64761.1 hypothetical protein C922_04905 [Plasmodium inui San Antonio 1]
MEVDFVSEQRRNRSGLLFDKGGESAGEVPGEAAGEEAGEEPSEEVEKPPEESIIPEGVDECFVRGDGEKDCAERKPPRDPDASESDCSPTEMPICEKEQLGVNLSGDELSGVKLKVEDSEKTGEEAACTGKNLHGGENELPQLNEPEIKGVDTISERHTNQSRRVTPNRQGKTERINQLYRNSKTTNIKLYRRMYQSYLLLRKEQNELLVENRRKEERNMKLKYELDSLRGNSYYANCFFNNDSDNLFEDLASGISNIWKWMDMESKSGQMRSGQVRSGHMESGRKGKVGPAALADDSEGVPPPREGEPGRDAHRAGVDGTSESGRLPEEHTPSRAPLGGKPLRGGAPQAEWEAVHNEVHKPEYRAQYKEKYAGDPTCEYANAPGRTSPRRGVASSQDRPDEHSEGYEPTSDAPSNGVQLEEVHLKGVQQKGVQQKGVHLNAVQMNGGRCPMENGHRRNTSEVRMDSPSRINEKEATRTMKGIPPHERKTQQGATHNGGQKKRVHFVKEGYKHTDKNDRNEVTLPPSHNFSSQDDKMEKKNSFLWEKESRPVKKGCVKYAHQMHKRFAYQDRSSPRVDREPSAFTSIESPKDNIIDYIKGRLSSGGMIHGKASLPSGKNTVMGIHPSWIRPNVDPNRIHIKEEENFLFHICNCKGDKYVPLNVGSFFMVSPKRTRPDEEFSLGTLQKCMDFIFRRKERSNHSEVRIRHKKCSDVPCEGVPLANGTANVGALNEEKRCVPRKDQGGVGKEEKKDPSPVGQSNGEQDKKKTRLLTKVALKEGDKTGGLQEGEEKQVLKKGQSGRKLLLKIDRNRRPNEGRTLQNCQLKGKKETKYNRHKMDMGLGRKFGHIVRRKGSTRRRDSWGGLNFKVVPKKEEKGGEISSPVVKVRAARLAPHVKGRPRHVCFARIGRRLFHPKRSRRACIRFEEVPKGKKNRTRGKGNLIELAPKLCDNLGTYGRSSEEGDDVVIRKANQEREDMIIRKANEEGDAVPIGKEDNLKEGDTPERHAANSQCSAITPERYNASLRPFTDSTPPGCLQRENDSVANRDALTEALTKHVQSLDFSARQIDCIEEENLDVVTIIGIQIKVRDGHIYLHLDALSTIEDTVTVWIKKNEQVLNNYVKGSELILSTLEYYCVDMFTFLCIFLDLLENHVEEFPFYLSVSLEEIFCVQRDC